MHNFSFRPTLTLKRRPFKAVRVFAGRPSHPSMPTRINADGPVGYQAVEFLDLPPMEETVGNPPRLTVAVGDSSGDEPW